MIPVRISVAQMRQRFHGCEADYIRDVCHARCCDAPSRPQGTLITIHQSEVPVIVRRGGTVLNGILQTPSGKCTFKTDDHLCSLHFTPDKPFGCIASPFTLNKRDALVVRNRYRMLPCYRKREEGDGHPAYVAFRASLDLIFGPVSAFELVTYLNRETSDDMIQWEMPDRSYEMLKSNDEAKSALR